MLVHIVCYMGGSYDLYNTGCEPYFWSAGPPWSMHHYVVLNAVGSLRNLTPRVEKLTFFYTVRCCLSSATHHLCGRTSRKCVQTSMLCAYWLKNSNIPSTINTAPATSLPLRFGGHFCGLMLCLYQAWYMYLCRDVWGAYCTFLV